MRAYLDSSAVANEGSGHLETTRWDITYSSLYVVGDPFDEVRAVLVLNVQHLFVNLFHGHASTEHGRNGQVSTMTWVTSGHHVLGIEHLLSKFRNGQGTVLLAASAGQRSKARHEEVKTREGNHVNGQLAQISV